MNEQPRNLGDINENEGIEKNRWNCMRPLTRFQNQRNLRTTMKLRYEFMFLFVSL